MVFTGEASWRWRMMMPSTDRSFDTFWRQAIRWLSLQATDPICITAPAAAAPGTPIALRVAVRDAAFEPLSDVRVDVHFSGPGGLEHVRAGLDQTEDADGRYVARFRPPQPGIYRIAVDVRRGSAVLGTGATSILVGGSDPEMADPRLNLELLQRLAISSAGRVIGENDIQVLAASLRSGLPAAALAVRRDLWHNGWSFAALALLLGAEWILRRRWGLR
jgi:hypothetical protein